MTWPKCCTHVSSNVLLDADADAACMFLLPLCVNDHYIVVPSSSECKSSSSRGLVRKEQEDAWVKAAMAAAAPVAGSAGPPGSGPRAPAGPDATSASHLAIPLHIFRLGGECLSGAGGLGRGCWVAAVKLLLLLGWEAIGYVAVN